MIVGPLTNDRDTRITAIQAAELRHGESSQPVRLTVATGIEIRQRFLRQFWMVDLRDLWRVIDYRIQTDAGLIVQRQLSGPSLEAKHAIVLSAKIANVVFLGGLDPNLFMVPYLMLRVRRRDMK